MKDLICNSYIYDTNITNEVLEKIDFNKIDIVNVAFSTLEKNNDGKYVPTLNDGLKSKIQLLKNHLLTKNAKSRVVISIGGCQADHFCPASSSEQNRKAFAAECKKMLETYELDGIDIDWEFPGTKGDGLSYCKNCKKDFIMLCAEIRSAIGDKLLTCAVGSDRYSGIDGKKLNQLVDYINVMTYDMGVTHQSHMFLIKLFVNSWARIGIQKHKLLIGIPFYARSLNSEYEWFGYNKLIQCVKDDKAKIVYNKNQNYALIDKSKLTIDTPSSIKIKADYVKHKGFGGLFNWEESSDFDGELRNAMYKYLHEN